MYVIVWSFRPRLERIADFESTYGPDGAWACLFARAEGFLGTDLWKSRGEDEFYLTSDRWQSEQHYWRFRQQFHAAYSELDVKTEGLTLEEILIGQFDAL